jgi:hypothetical protein
MPKAITFLAMLCALLGSAAMLTPSFPLRGWVGLVAFGVLGVICATDRVAIARRFNAVMCVFLLLNGVSFGVPKIWVPHPPWLAVLADMLFFGALIAAVVALWFTRGHPVPVHADKAS